MTDNQMELPRYVLYLLPSSGIEMEKLMGRHDYYQTSTHLIAAVYLKGYAAEGVKEQVEVKFESGSVGLFVQDLWVRLIARSRSMYLI
jgi:hypothetical protein